MFHRFFDYSQCLRLQQTEFLHKSGKKKKKKNHTLIFNSVLMWVTTSAYLMMISENMPTFFYAWAYFLWQTANNFEWWNFERNFSLWLKKWKSLSCWKDERKLQHYYIKWNTFYETLSLFIISTSGVVEVWWSWFS